MSGLMLLMIMFFSLIIYGLLTLVRISSVKVMLLGIALMSFLNSVLRDVTNNDVDIIVSLIGISLCIAGFIKRETTE